MSGRQRVVQYNRPFLYFGFGQLQTESDQIFMFVLSILKVNFFYL